MPWLRGKKSTFLMHYCGSTSPKVQKYAHNASGVHQNTHNLYQDVHDPRTTQLCPRPLGTSQLYQRPLRTTQRCPRPQGTTQSCPRPQETCPCCPCPPWSMVMPVQTTTNWYQARWLSPTFLMHYCGSTSTKSNTNLSGVYQCKVPMYFLSIQTILGLFNPKWHDCHFVMGMTKNV